MKQNTEVTRYSAGSKLLHWVIAVLVITMLAFSFFLGDLSDTLQPTAYMIHKSCGLTVLALMILRLVWIKHRGKPALPAHVPAWERVFSRVVQGSFYVFLIAMPLCGWLMSVAAGRAVTYFGLFQVPSFGIKPNEALDTLMDQSHKTIAWILIILLVLHVAGALKHYFIDKDGVTERMLPRG